MTGWLGDGWADVIVAVLSVAAVAIVGGLLTEIGPWYEGLRFPALRPPNWLFGPAWTVIFALIAISGVMAWRSAADGGARNRLLSLFALNALLNLGWSPLFFKLRRPDWAFAELVVFWLSIIALIAAIAEISGAAALVISPYLVWVSFAGWLNWRVVQLNKPFAGRGIGRTGSGARGA